MIELDYREKKPHLDHCLPMASLSRPAGVGHGLTLLAAGCRGWDPRTVGPNWKQNRSC